MYIWNTIIIYVFNLLFAFSRNDLIEPSEEELMEALRSQPHMKPLHL